MQHNRTVLDCRETQCISDLPDGCCSVEPAVTVPGTIRRASGVLDGRMAEGHVVFTRFVMVSGNNRYFVWTACQMERGGAGPPFRGRETNALPTKRLAL